jgi:hypothetical protein
VVDDDLPALIGFFEDEREDTAGGAAFFFAAIEVVFTDDYGELFVEGMDFQLREGQGAHDCFGRVVVAVFVEHAIDTAEDLVGDEEGIGGVFVALNKGWEIAFVPSVFLGHEDLDDVELLLGGGLELIVLREGRESEGEDKCEDCGVAAWHGGHLV